MRYHFTLVRMVIIKKSTNNKHWRGCGEKGNSYTAGRNVNWHNRYGNRMEVSLKLKPEPPYDLAIPLLGIYRKKTVIQKVTCTPVFTAALFTIAKT